MLRLHYSSGTTKHQVHSKFSILNKKEKKDNKMHQKYICIVCDYIYDPILGDPDSGIAPGTVFEDIPDDWECPDCGVSKEDFEPYEED